MMEKKKRGRPKGTGPSKKGIKYGGRNIFPKKRGRKPKNMFSSSPILSTPSELASPSQQSPSTHFGDEFFTNSTSDLLNYDDDVFNDMDFGIGPSSFNSNCMSIPTPSVSSNDSHFITEHHSSGSSGSFSSSGFSTGSSGELKVRLKVPSMFAAAQQRKRGRKPKKTPKVKIVKEGYEKRKYTKRKLPRDAEDTSNLRRSTRPPQASKAFDDHYLL